jgi:hypothetical protein
MEVFSELAMLKREPDDLVGIVLARVEALEAV